MNDRLRGRSGRLNRVPFLHGHRRFRDTDSGLRLRCKHACSKQEQRCRKCARPDRKPAETQNRADTLFRAASGKAAAKGRRPDLPLCHVKKRQCVGFFADRAKRAQNGLIAGQFHIAVRKAHHKPNQRVPPVQAQTGSQQQLTQAVFAADMRQFVRQDKLKLYLTGLQIVRQQHRRTENAERQRRAAALGRADFRVACKTEPFQQYIDGRLRQNTPRAKTACHADIADSKVCSKNHRDPDPEQQFPVRPSGCGCF